SVVDPEMLGKPDVVGGLQLARPTIEPTNHPCSRSSRPGPRRRQIALVAVRSNWDVDPVQRRDLFLEVRSPNRRLDHQELTGPRVTFEFDAAHADEADGAEEFIGHALQRVAILWG